MLFCKIDRDARNCFDRCQFMPVIPASDGFAVTAYETWSTEARRGVDAAQASGHDRKFVVALARV